jgi:hypothetical protein
LVYKEFSLLYFNANVTSQFDERLLTARISHYQELEQLSHLRPDQHAGPADVLIAVDFPHRQEATCSASHFFNARMTVPYSTLVSLRSSKLEAMLYAYISVLFSLKPPPSYPHTIVEMAPAQKVTANDLALPFQHRESAKNPATTIIRP